MAAALPCQQAWGIPHNPLPIALDCKRVGAAAFHRLPLPDTFLPSPLPSLSCSVPLKKLLDVRDIPIPQTSDSDGDHDPIKLYDYFAEKTTERLVE